MPRYFYHVVDGERERDPEGMEFPNDGAAQREAVRYCGELLQGNAIDLWTSGQCRVEVTNDRGTHKWTIVAMAIDAPPPEDQPADD